MAVPGVAPRGAKIGDKYEEITNIINRAFSSGSWGRS